MMPSINAIIFEAAIIQQRTNLQAKRAPNTGVQGGQRTALIAVWI
jgi:hypothetical protein